MVNENLIEHIKSYYKLIFSFPSSKILYLFSGSILLVFFFISYKYIGLKYIPLLFILITCILLQLIFSRVMSEMLTLRRLFGLFSILIVECIFIIIILIFRYEYGSRILQKFSLAITPFYSFILFIDVVFTRKKCIPLIVTSISFALNLMILSILNNYSFIIVALSLFTILNISVFMFLEYFNRDSKKILNLNGINLIYSFLNVFLSNNMKPLEKLFANHLCIKYMADFYIIYFVSQNDKIVGSIIIPGIHFGPFRHLGSSSFSGNIIRKFMDNRIPALVLHRASTHEYDAVSSQEIDLIIETLLRKVLKKRGKLVKVSNLRRLYLNNFSCLYQYLSNNVLLAIVSSEKYGMEDIPMEIEKKISSSLKRKILVIDAHNRITDPSFSFPLSNKLKQNMLDLLKKCVLNPYKEKWYDTLYIGFSTLLDLDYNGQEIASGGITTMVIKNPSNKKSYFLIAIDSNNMISGIRDKVRKYLIEKYGFDDGEIVTTDTHEYTGIRPGTYYYPLGKNISYITIRKNIETCLQNAFLNMHRCSIYFIEDKIEIKILGKKNLEKINNFISRHVWRSMTFLLVLLFLPILLSIII